MKTSVPANSIARMLHVLYAVIGSFGLLCWVVSLVKLSLSAGQLVFTMWSVIYLYFVTVILCGIVKGQDDIFTIRKGRE